MSIVAKTEAALQIIEQYQLEVISLRTDFSGCSIHVIDNEEMEKFGDLVKVRKTQLIDFPEELVATIDGIKIFSLVEAEKVGAAS